MKLTESIMAPMAARVHSVMPAAKGLLVVLLVAMFFCGSGSVAAQSGPPSPRPWNDYVDQITSVDVEDGVQTDGDLVFSCDYAPTDSNPKTEYAITSSGLSSADYAVTFVNGTLTVSQPTVKLRIVDPDEGVSVADVTFQILDQSSNPITDGEGTPLIWTSAVDNVETADVDESIIEIAGLQPGQLYFIAIVDAPTTYLLGILSQFTLDANGDIAHCTDEINDGVLETTLVTTYVEFGAYLETLDAFMEGATVQVIHIEDGAEVIDQELESEENPSFIESLHRNKEYILRMTEAPYGFTAPADITFSIADDGSIVTDGPISDDNVLLLNLGCPIVKVRVVATASDAPIVGATMQVILGTDNVVAQWITQDDDPSTEDIDERIHVVEGLIAGNEYTLHQASAPNGYLLSDDATFAIDPSGKITSTGSVTADGVLLVTNAAARATLFAEGSANLWMTWCDKVAYVKPEGVTVYTISTVTASAVTLEELADDLIPAYMPVILHRLEAGAEAVTAAIRPNVPNPQTGYDDATGICSQSNQAATYTFFGATTALDKIPDADVTYYNGGLTYVLYGDKFLMTDANNGIAANRCWLLLPAEDGTGGANARQLIISTGADTTGILDRRIATDGSLTGEWYGLDGRKLDGKPAQKGIYIYYGKKTVVK